MAFAPSVLSVSCLNREVYHNRFDHTYLGAEPLSSLSKQLHDQGERAQSMSKVIGLTYHETLLENYYI